MTDQEFYDVEIWPRLMEIENLVNGRKLGSMFTVQLLDSDKPVYVTTLSPDKTGYVPQPIANAAAAVGGLDGVLPVSGGAPDDDFPARLPFHDHIEATRAQR